MTNPDALEAPDAGLLPVTLKPCPFCKGKAAVHWYDGFPSVVCQTCACNTGMNLNGSEAEAITAWNTRAPLQSASPSGLVWVPADTVRLVIAAREVAFGGLFDSTDPDKQAAIRELDQASEAFASRVPWENEDEA